MNKRKFLFLFRLLVIISLFAGIILNISYASHIVKILSYYTLQMNIFCLVNLVIFVIADIFKLQYKNRFYYLVKGEMVISMLLMMIIYAVALMPRNFQMYTFSTRNKTANILVHIVSPTLVILEYLIFDEKGKFQKSFPIKWIISPMAYVVYVYTYSAFGGRFYNIGGSSKFAYLFLDYEKYGPKKVFLWLVCMLLVIVAIGYILYFIDSKLAKKR